MFREVKCPIAGIKYETLKTQHRHQGQMLQPTSQKVTSILSDIPSWCR